MLANVIADRNAKCEEFEYLDEVRRNESLNSTTFYIDWAANDDRPDLSITYRTVPDRYDYTLPNGTVIQFAAMDARGDGSHVGGGGISQYYGPLVEGATLQGNDDYGNDGVSSICFVAVGSDSHGRLVHTSPRILVFSSDWNPYFGVNRPVRVGQSNRAVGRGDDGRDCVHTPISSSCVYSGKRVCRRVPPWGIELWSVIGLLLGK
jgi:hypothetical protein